jgi:hypothetical protein
MPRTPERARVIDLAHRAMTLACRSFVLGWLIYEETAHSIYTENHGRLCHGKCTSSHSRIHGTATLLRRHLLTSTNFEAPWDQRRTTAKSHLYLCTISERPSISHFLLVYFSFFNTVCIEKYSLHQTRLHDDTIVKDFMFLYFDGAFFLHEICSLGLSNACILRFWCFFFPFLAPPSCLISSRNRSEFLRSVMN